MPASEQRMPVITGTHTGKEEGHTGVGVVVAGLDMVKGAEVVTGGLCRLLTLVKMKGLASEGQWILERSYVKLL